MLAFTVEIKGKWGTVRREGNIVGKYAVSDDAGPTDFDKSWDVFARWIAEKSPTLRSRDVTWVGGWLEGQKIVFTQVQPSLVRKSNKLTAPAS